MSVGGIVEVGRSEREVSIEWRIPDVLRLLSKNETFHSDGFSFCSADWRFMSFNRLLKLSFAFHPKAGRPRAVNASLGVRGAEGKEREEVAINQRIGCWSVPNFFLEPRLRNSGLDGLVVTCELKVPYPIVRDMATAIDGDMKEDQISKKQAVEELQESLQGLLASQEGSDVVIRVRDKEFQAHRSILGARSPVFRAMFSHNMIEKRIGVVTLGDPCDPDTFTDFLDHVYSGNIAMVSSRNVFGLYVTADKYDLKVLKKECAKFLRRNMDVSSFCNAIALAVRHDEKELTVVATEFFLLNSSDIVSRPDWPIFVAENPMVGMFLEALIDHSQDQE